MKSYCIKQKKETDCVPGREKTVVAKNGRIMMKCICVECGATKNRFIKKNDQMKRVKPEIIMSKKRMNLISQRIEYNAALKKLRDELLYTNKRDSGKIKEIKDKAAKIIKKRNAVNIKLQEIDRFTIPNIDVSVNPNTDRRFQQLIAKKPMRNLKIPNIDVSVNPNTDRRFQQLIAKMPVKKTKAMRNLKKDLSSWFDESEPEIDPQPKIDKMKTEYADDYVDKKIKSYYNKKRNKEMIDKIISFMDQFDDEKIGTEMKRKGFVLKKIGKDTFDVYYESGGRRNIYLLDKSKGEVIDALHKFDFGIIIIWDGNKLLNIEDPQAKIFIGDNPKEGSLHNVTTRALKNISKDLSTWFNKPKSKKEIADESKMEIDYKEIDKMIDLVVKDRLDTHYHGEPDQKILNMIIDLTKDFDKKGRGAEIKLGDDFLVKKIDNNLFDMYYRRGGKYNTLAIDLTKNEIMNLMYQVIAELFVIDEISGDIYHISDSRARSQIAKNLIKEFDPNKIPKRKIATERIKDDLESWFDYKKKKPKKKKKIPKDKVFSEENINLFLERFDGRKVGTMLEMNGLFFKKGTQGTFTVFRKKPDGKFKNILSRLEKDQMLYLLKLWLQENGYSI